MPPAEEPLSGAGFSLGEPTSTKGLGPVAKGRVIMSKQAGLLRSLASFSRKECVFISRARGGSKPRARARSKRKGTGSFGVQTPWGSTDQSPFIAFTILYVYSCLVSRNFLLSKYSISGARISTFDESFVKFRPVRGSFFHYGRRRNSRSSATP